MGDDNKDAYPASQGAEDAAASDTLLPPSLSSGELVRIRVFEGDRRVLQPWFELADDSRQQVATYLFRGEVLVALDSETEQIVGYLQLVDTDQADVFELKSMAVDEAHRGRGIGRALVDEAVARCQSSNGRRLIVATAAADTGNLRFYQRMGFRMHRIVRDAFGPSSGYPEGILIDGILLRDQVFLDRDLAPSAK